MHEGAEIIISFTVNPIDLALRESLAALLFWNPLSVCVYMCVCAACVRLCQQETSLPTPFQYLQILASIITLRRNQPTGGAASRRRRPQAN